MDANRAAVCPVPETQKPSAPITITHKTAWGSDEVSQTTAFCGVGKLAFFHKRRREEVFTQAQSRKEQSFLFQSTVSQEPFARQTLKGRSVGFPNGVPLKF